MTDSRKSRRPGASPGGRNAVGAGSPGKKPRTAGLEGAATEKEEEEESEVVEVDYQRNMLPPRDESHEPEVNKPSATNRIHGAQSVDGLLPLRNLLLHAQRNRPIGFDSFWRELVGLHQGLIPAELERLATEPVWEALVLELGFELSPSMASDPELKRRILELFAQGAQA